MRGEAPKLLGRNGPAIFAVGPIPGFAISLLLRIVLLRVLPPLGAVPYCVLIWRAVPHILYRRLVVQYNSSYAILNYHYTTINGLKLGVKFKNRFHTSATIYFLSTSVPVCHIRPENAVPNAVAELCFRYLAAYGEYVLLETFRWEMSSNLQLGMGRRRCSTPSWRANPLKRPRNSWA